MGKNRIKFELLSSPLYTEAGKEELKAIGKKFNCHAVLLPTSKYCFSQLNLHDMVDELVVYKIGSLNRSPNSISLDLSLPPNKWFLCDYSPLGDSTRYIYRTVKIDGKLVLH